jgi:hypothetical protein
VLDAGTANSATTGSGTGIGESPHVATTLSVPSSTSRGNRKLIYLPQRRM